MLRLWDLELLLLGLAGTGRGRANKGRVVGNRQVVRPLLRVVIGNLVIEPGVTIRRGRGWGIVIKTLGRKACRKDRVQRGAFVGSDSTDRKKDRFAGQRRDRFVAAALPIRLPAARWHPAARTDAGEASAAQRAAS